MRIGVISGGFSTEREQSLQNGRSIADALMNRHDVILIEYSPNIIEDIRKCGIDFAFIAVQGRYHGDGTIQAILDLMGIPYSGSKACAAAIINNKLVCKQIWKSCPDIITPDFFKLNMSDYQKGLDHFCEKVEAAGGFPMVAKPVSQGASIGIEWIKTASDFGVIPDVFIYDSTILIEKFINSRYITQPVVAVDGVPEAFPLVEARSLYEMDEYRKYNGKYELSYPDLGERLTAQISQMSLAAFETAGAVAYARIDYALGATDGVPYILEINAVPGMADMSLVPFSCAKAGLTRPEILDIIIKNSYV